MNVDTRILDALAEMMNLGVGKSAAVLNAMLSSHVSLSAPEVFLMTADEFRAISPFPEGVPFSAIEMGYTGELKGVVELVFDTASAGRLVDALVGDASTDDPFDSLRAGTLCEVGNVVINAVLGTMANQLDLGLSFSVPFYHEGGGDSVLRGVAVGDCDVVLLTKATFRIREMSVTGDLAVFFSFSSYSALEARILASGDFRT